MNDYDLKEQMLLDLHKLMGTVKQDIAEIKADIRNHIKRTDQNEMMIQHLEDRLDNESAFFKKNIYIIYGTGIALFTIFKVIPWQLIFK